MEEKETSLQNKINDILQKYVKKQNLFTSISYLFRDVLLSIVFTYISYECKNIFIVNTPSLLLWFLFYSSIQGTIWTGLWVLGHECGHGAFAKNKQINDIFGLIIHSFLLVPYYSWQCTHNKHHKYTNHLVLGESHVPAIKEELLNVHSPFIIGILNLLLGWPIYLLFNITGGRREKIENNSILSLSHFNPNSVIFPTNKYNYVVISNIFVIMQLCFVFSIDIKYGFGTSILWYFGPLVVTNSWLVLYTVLQHTNKNIPHYGGDTFTWLKGALCTIDRKYPYLIDEMHHYIGSTHVVHHLCYSIPHYYAKQATEELKPILGDNYHYDSSNIIVAFFRTVGECRYVDDITGTQYYKTK
jgi:omega-6 fatty acid desaturase (delta-12 desaturase)